MSARDEDGVKKIGRTTLADISFFRDVDAATVAEMERHCRWLELKKGEVLIEAGEFPERVFFLLHGELRFSLYTRIGKILSLPAVMPGAFVGTTALVKETPHPYSIDAAMPSTLASMNVRVFQDLLQRNPDVLQALFRTFVERQHILVHYIEELTTLNVRARIQNELSRLCRSSTDANGSAVISPAPTHEELANRVGTQREAVSRELSHLQQMGIIVRQDGALFIQDVARLMDPPLKLKD